MTFTTKQKIAFADAIAESTLFLEIEDAVKIIAATSQDELSWAEIFATLRENDILNNDNVPTEIAHNRGIIATRRIFVDDEDDGSYQLTSSVVTGKGLIHIVNLFNNKEADDNA
jgi:phage antirepressor YoqD-like protein